MFFKRGLAAILAAVTVVGLAGCGDAAVIPTKQQIQTKQQ